MKRSLIALLCITALSLCAGIDIDRKAYSIRISDDGARMLGITGKITGTTFAANTDLWEISFNYGAKQNSTEFIKSGGKFSHQLENDRLTLRYRSDQRDFDIVFTLRDDEFEYRVMNLRNTGRAIMTMAVPAELTFPLSRMRRFLYPTQANWSMGICFRPPFFEKRTEDEVIYKTCSAPFNGMEKLFGGKTVEIPNSEYKQKAHTIPTSYGEAFYNAAEKKDLLRAVGRVSSRQTSPGGLELAFLRNQNDENPLLTATQFGGKGYLFQMLAHNQNGTERASFMEAIFHNTVSALLRHHPELLTGKRLILLDYPNTPKLITGFDPVSLDMKDWHSNLEVLAKRFNIPVSTAKNIGELRAALSDPDTGIIVNPYGNIFPSAEPEKFAEDLGAIREYVKRGGIWWESGVRSFDTLLGKTYYAEYDREARYPSAAADYACAEYADGSVAMFGVQPTMRFPYDRERAAIPASYHLKGTPPGACFVHRWVLWADSKSKRLWESSPYRISFRYQTPREGLAAYEETLELNSRLTDKVKPEILDKLKNAMLICCWHETAEDNIKSFQVMPPDNIAHFIGALASRFDANYPEHLPPDPKWGTLEDLKRMIRAGHERGHLVMPYTNTTWWLPHENKMPSPSMQKWMDKKEEVMALNADGSPSWRRGRTGVGWALNFYHPYVREASLLVTRQFADYGCDMIFMDEMGGHPWKYDFNPLEPWPATALDGRISMCWDSSKILPAATEEGHDRLLNFNTMICGGTWKTFPNTQFETQRYVHQYRPQDWQYWPTFTYLGHDKSLFTVHDLQERYDDFEHVSLALSFGYKMKYALSYRISRENLAWCHFLDAIQKTVAREYEGRKLIAFSYPLENTGSSYRNQFVYAEYDNGVKMICNHSDQKIALDRLELPFAPEELAWLRKQTLPPYGFYVSTKNGKCAYLIQNGNRFGFALADEKNAYRGAIFTLDQAAVHTLPDNPLWKTGSFGKLTVSRRDGHLELTMPAAGAPDQFNWWFSHYNEKVSGIRKMISNGKPEAPVLAEEKMSTANNRLVFAETPGRKLQLRLPENYRTMTLAADVTVTSLPRQGLVPLVVRPGCNSVLGLDPNGKIIFTMWYADKKTQNHISSITRLKPGESARVAVTVEVKDGQTTLKLIVNGKEEASRTTAQEPFPYGPHCNIAPEGKNQNMFIGSIENMFVANTALTPAEIQSLQGSENE